MVFGSRKDRLDTIEDDIIDLREQARRHEERLDDHEVRISELERVHSALDEFSGYGDMTRDELLRIQGVLDVHEQTLESLIEWATTEDYRERVKGLRYRFRHHRTRSRNALAALDG